MSYKLQLPNNQKTDFIVEYNHNQSLKIEDGSDTYEVDDLTFKGDFIFALEANEIMADVEVEIDVPTFQTVEKEIINPETSEVEIIEVEEPVMIEVEETITVIDYDEDGNPIGEHKETITKLVQDYHKETTTVNKPIVNPNYEQEQAERERQRLDALTLTPSDVERALYYSDLHMDFDDLKSLISEKAPQMDLKGLAIEFRANNFYRGAVDKDGNRIIDVVGALIGYTSADMDYLFEHKELPIKEVENENTND